jgi:predicted MFS family arabinose efflux permease
MATAAPTAVPHALSRTLRVRPFRVALSATCASNFGSWMQTVAAGWLAYRLTGSAAAVGVLTALAKGPGLLLSAYGGALAERSDPRRLGILLSLLQGAPCLALALFGAVGDVTMLLLYAATFAVGVAGALVQPLTEGTLRRTVPPELRPTAIRLGSIGWNASRLGGPVAGAALTEVVGPEACFLVNGLSFAAIALMFTMLHLPAPRRDANGGVRAAARLARTHVPIPQLLIGLTLFSLLVAPVQELAPKLADHYGDGAHTIAFLLLAIAAGSFAGNALVGRRQARDRTDLSTLATGLTICAAGLAVTALELGLAPTLAALVVVGVGWELIWVSTMTGVQLRAPEGTSHRMLGLFFTLALGGVTAGALLVGGLLDAFGVRATLLVTAAVLVGCAAWTARIALRHAPAAADA